MNGDAGPAAGDARAPRDPPSVMVKPGSLSELWNPLDASPLAHRALDTGLLELLERVASPAEAHAASPRLEIRLRAGAPVARLEAFRSALRWHFDCEAARLRSDIALERRRAMRLFLAAVGALVLLATLRATLPDGLFAGAAGDVAGLVIAISAWVALWIPVECLLFAGWEASDRLARLDWLARTCVELREDHGSEG